MMHLTVYNIAAVYPTILSTLKSLELDETQQITVPFG